jgi:polyisoprenoid-binding protein YceI
VRLRDPWVVMASLVALQGAPLLSAHHLDSSNTKISFEIERFGLHWFSVDFHDVSGDFALASDGHGGSLTVVVRTDSIDARSTYWNERLRSAQWLDTGTYPQMVYRSTGITFADPAHALVQGELTLHGVTRPLALSISDIDCPQAAQPPARTCRFLGRARLKRSDYGIPHGFWAGGDAVEIVVRGD